jgi:2-iminobutanoate/2-iminopropanoate deaminase
MNTLEIVQSGKLGPSAGPFSTAIKANGFLFLSGQVGMDSQGKLAEGFEQEVRQVMENIGLILSEEGLGYEDLASMTVYLKDMTNFQRLNDIYKTYFAGRFPTRTCIAVADLPVKANVEMTATALLKK